MRSPTRPVGDGKPASPVTNHVLLAAGVYAAALIAAGFLVPMYTTESATSPGAVTQGSATLVEVKGVAVLLVLALPLLATLAVAVALRSSASAQATKVAWALTAGLAVVNLLALMSIGAFILPVTGALVVACALDCRSTTERGSGPGHR